MDPARPESDPAAGGGSIPGGIPPRLTPPRKKRTGWRFSLIAGLMVVVLITFWRTQKAQNQRPDWRSRGFGPNPMAQNPWRGGDTPRSKTPAKKRVRESINGPRAAIPHISRAGGVFSEGIKVELQTDAPAGKIRYTLDGSEPTVDSTLYNGPVAIGSTTLLQAKAFEPNVSPSPTVSETYTFLDASLASFTSNLPLIVVNAFGQQINKQGAVPGSIRIIDGKGKRTTLTGESDYDGRCEVKLRGYSSLRFPKHSLTVKTRDASGASRKSAILGLPEDSDWVLYAPYSDKTLMRDVLAYELSNKMGRYAARTRYVEVFVNRNGGKLSRRDYVGVYVFEEKIKRSKERVNVKKLTPEDNAEPEISGGYIIKRDHTSPPGEGQFGFFNQNQNGSSDAEGGFRTGRGQYLFFVEPKAAEITSAQKEWLARYMTQFEKALYGSGFRNPTEGYAKYLDVDSFIDQFWIVELSKNVDGFRYSCYMSKDRNGKIRMEPIWDWNLSFGNANYHEGWSTANWYWPLLRDSEISWFKRLRQDPEFMQRLVDRWAELRKGVFAPETILKRVDELADQLQEAQGRNFQRWPILGQFVNPNWYVGGSFDDEVSWMKNWIQERIAWIDGQFLSSPVLSRKEVSGKAGSQVKMRCAAGTIYFTADGSDPRLPGGAISPLAKEYSDAVVLEPGIKVFARCRSGDIWSGPAIGLVPGGNAPPP